MPGSMRKLKLSRSSARCIGLLSGELDLTNIMAAYSASNNFWSFVMEPKDFGGHFTDTSPDVNVRDSSFFQCRLAGGMRDIQPRASTFCALVAKDPRSDTVADVELVEGIDTSDGTNVPCGLSGEAAGTVTEEGETLTGFTGGLPYADGLSISSSQAKSRRWEHALLVEVNRHLCQTQRIFLALVSRLWFS